MDRHRASQLGSCNCHLPSQDFSATSRLYDPNETDHLSSSATNPIMQVFAFRGLGVIAKWILFLATTRNRLAPAGRDAGPCRSLGKRFLHTVEILGHGYREGDLRKDKCASQPRE